MNKLIAAFDGLHYAHSTQEYAGLIAEKTSAHLVGIFLDDSTYTSYKVFELVSKEGSVEHNLAEADKKDTATRLSASKQFETFCQHRHLNVTIRHDRKIALKEIVHESAFSDLVVIAATETLTHHEEPLPSRFLRDFLGDTHCPIIVVPEMFHHPDRVVLLYDGLPSSVHAIKMFCYLLGELCELPVELVMFKPVHSSRHLPDQLLLNELLKRHFNKIKTTILAGEGEEELINYVSALPGFPLVVMGAYHRSPISRKFHPSLADKFIKQKQFPVFIAHN